jgi:hypothetical protein
MEKSMGIPKKERERERELPCDLEIPLLGIYPK